MGSSRWQKRRGFISNRALIVMDGGARGNTLCHMLEWKDSEEDDELGEKKNSMERGQLYIAVDNFKVDQFTSHVRRLCVAIPSNPDHPTRYLVSSCPGLLAKYTSPDRATLFPISYSIPLPALPLSSLTHNLPAPCPRI